MVAGVVATSMTVVDDDDLLPVVVYGPCGAHDLGTNHAAQGLQNTCPHKRQ